MFIRSVAILCESINGYDTLWTQFLFLLSFSARNNIYQGFAYRCNGNESRITSCEQRGAFVSPNFGIALGCNGIAPITEDEPTEPPRSCTTENFLSRSQECVTWASNLFNSTRTNTVMQFYDLICDPCGGCTLSSFAHPVMQTWLSFTNYTVEEMQVTCGVMLWKLKHWQLVTVQFLQHTLLAMRHL